MGQEYEQESWMGRVLWSQKAKKVCYGDSKLVLLQLASNFEDGIAGAMSCFHQSRPL